MILVQPGAQPVTNQQVRMTTASGTVFQLMGSDSRFAFPEFHIVIAYNGIHHFTPTCFLSNTSLSDWRLSCFKKHLEAAFDFFSEAEPFLDDDELKQKCDEVVNYTREQVFPLIHEQCKRGTTAATQEPITMLGPKPKRSDEFARHGNLPKKDVQHYVLPQPMLNIRTDPLPGEATFTGRSSEQASTPSSSGPSQPPQSGLSAKRKQKGTDSDPEYIPSQEEIQEAEANVPPPPTKKLKVAGPAVPLPPQRKQSRVPKENYKYKCDICDERFQRTNEKRNHIFIKHQGGSFDCVQCEKTFSSERAMISHNRTKHEGIAKLKCNQEGCSYTTNDPGQLPQHYLEAHQIGQPMKCLFTNEDGQICGRVFVNSRSFQQHSLFHEDKKYMCEDCNRWFKEKDKLDAHWNKFHNPDNQPQQYLCSECGKALGSTSSLKNHMDWHKLQTHKTLKQQASAAAGSSATLSDPVNDPLLSSTSVHNLSAEDMEEAMDLTLQPGGEEGWEQPHTEQQE